MKTKWFLRWYIGTYVRLKHGTNVTIGEGLTFIDENFPYGYGSPFLTYHLDYFHDLKEFMSVNSVIDYLKKL